MAGQIGASRPIPHRTFTICGVNAIKMVILREKNTSVSSTLNFLAATRPGSASQNTSASLSVGIILVPPGVLHVLPPQPPSREPSWSCVAMTTAMRGLSAAGRWAALSRILKNAHNR